MQQKNAQEAVENSIIKTADSMSFNGSPYPYHIVNPSNDNDGIFNAKDRSHGNAIVKRKNSEPLFRRSDSTMSTASVYAIPDEVQSALAQYQNKVQDLEKELKEERKRALTLSHQQETQSTILKEHEEKLNMTKEENDKKISFFRDELQSINQAYFHLWIKQCN